MEPCTELAPLSPAEEDEKLGAEITLLAGQINAANFRLLTLIAAFDDRGAWGGGGTVRSCAHWLNWRCGIAMGAAREKVRVAHSLQELPLISGAFEAGEISYSKVRAMTRVATPENEDFLLTIARYGTASHVEQSVAKYRRVRNRCGDRAELEQRDERQLVHYQDDDGMWVIHAKLPAEEGSAVVKAIAAIVDPIWEEKRRVLMEQRKQEREASRISGSDSVVAGSESDNSYTANSYTADPHTADFDAEEAETVESVAEATEANGPQITDDHGGITAENVSAETPPQLVFTSPSGTTIESNLYPQFEPQAVATSEQALLDLAPDVDAMTAVTQWSGERCNYGMVVEALLERDGLF